MQIVAFVAFYIVLLVRSRLSRGAALLIFVLLFGENARWEGTVVERAHAFIHGGLCSLCAAGVERVCGRRGRRCVDAAAEACVERPNPFLQLVYLSLVTGGYAVFVAHAWQLMPGPYVSARHLWLGPAATCASLLAFLATSFSDPGTITAANVEAHLASYPFDGVLYTPKRCPTMRLVCPARSKFSALTRRRVARFDHFCAWMNNDIGERNYRYFLAFLAAHVLLCAYGAWMMFALVAGELVRHGIPDAFVTLRGEEVPLRRAPLALLQFAVFSYSPVACLGLFLLLTCILVASFLAYHLSLVASNTTTNEAWKRKDLREWLVERALEEAAKEAEAVREGGAAEEAGAGGARRSRWRRLLCLGGGGKRARGERSLPPALLREIDARCANIYDLGWRRNLVEVLAARSQQRRPEPAEPAEKED